MRIYGKEGSIFKILAFPDEGVSKGEYLLIRDEGKDVSVLVQVADIGYVETPGLLEELIREGLLQDGKPIELDPLGLGRTTRFLRDVKILTCVTRGVLKDGEVTRRMEDLPSRADSIVEKIPSSKVLAMASPRTNRMVHVGKDQDGQDIVLNAEALDGVLTLITGMKGTGKSHMAKLLLLELVRHGAPVLVFDLNGEYIGLGKRKDSLSPSSEDGVKVYYPGRNLFFTLEYLGLETVANLMSNVLGLPGISATVFREIWPLVENRGPVTLERLGEAVKRAVSNMMIKDALASRLLTLASCPFITHDRGKLTRIEDLVGPGRGVVIVLRDLTPGARKILVEMILNKLVSLLEPGIIHPMFLFAEEAHLYVRQTYWEDIVTRMRHFGLFVTFITNQPDALDHQIFRQLDNIFLFCFKNDHDLDMVSRISDIDAVSVKSLVKELPRGVCLGVGRAVSSMPTIISVKNLDVEPLGETRRVFQAARNAIEGRILV